MPSSFLPSQMYTNTPSPSNPGTNPLLWGDDNAANDELFTKYGFNTDDFFEMLRRLGAYQYEGAADQAQFQKGLQPQYQNTLKQLAMLFSSAGQNAAQNREIAGVGQNAASFQRSGTQALNRAGITSPGAQAGVGLDALGKKFEGTNAVQQKYLDPSHRAGQLQQLAGLLQGGMTNNPALQNLLGINSALNPQFQQNQQPSQSIWGSLLGLGGQLAGAGAFKF